MTNSMDTVLGQAAEAELEFETMFDQEDSLIDTVCGCNESGIPFTEADLEGDFNDLHNEERDAKEKDFEDTLETPGDDQGAKDPEGTDKPNDIKNSDLESDKKGEFADLHNEDRDTTEKEFGKEAGTEGDAQGAKNAEGTSKPNDIKASDTESDKKGEFADLHNEERDSSPNGFDKTLETPGDAQGAKGAEGTDAPNDIKKDDLQARNESKDVDTELDGDFDDLHNEDRDETPKEFEKDGETAGDANGAKNPEGTDKPTDVDNKDLQARNEANDVDAELDGDEDDKEAGEPEGAPSESANVEEGKKSCSCGKEDCPICGGKKTKSIDEELDPEAYDDEEVDEGCSKKGCKESATIDDDTLFEAASGDADVLAQLADDENMDDDIKDIEAADSKDGSGGNLDYSGAEDEDLIDMVMGEN